MKNNCENCQFWRRLGVWWGKCSNENRTAVETEDPGSGPEMTRKTFSCSAWKEDTVVEELIGWK